jgi:hypothetical protein
MDASQFEFAVSVLSVAQVVMVGGVDATTVTVKVQLGPWLLVQVTSVAPDWNVEPDGGSHVTVPQLPLVVAAG